MIVADERTWNPLGDGRDAQSYLTADAVAITQKFAMKFGNKLNVGEKISTVDSCTVISGTSLTTANLEPANDTTVAHADITLTAVTGERKFRWTVTTSGGDQLTAEGFLALE